MQKTGSKAERNAALDFTKGVLVVCMVVYHSVNYCSNDPEVLKFLRFLPPSFIFIAGFLLTNVYLAKYSTHDPQLHKRLFIRGAKLCGLFTLLNLAARSVLSQGHKGRSFGFHTFMEDVPSIFMAGNSSAAVFIVLLPISYLLMLAPGFLLLHGVHHLLLPAFAVIAFGVQWYLGGMGWSSANLNLFNMGLLGMVAGSLPVVSINRWAAHRIALAIAYVGYLAIVVIWNVNDQVLVLAVMLTLLLIYGVGLLCRGDLWIERQLVILGNYSLVAYIGQIAVLQVLSWLLRQADLQSARFLVLFLVTLLATQLAVVALNRLKANLPLADRLYRAVFA